MDYETIRAVADFVRASSVISKSVGKLRETMYSNVGQM